MKRVIFLVAFITVSPLTYAQTAGETLIQALPEGYIVARQISLRTSRVVWMVPESQSIENFTEVVTAITFIGDRSKSLKKFYGLTKKQWQVLCGRGQFSHYLEGAQSRYPVINWRQHCQQSKITGKPEVVLAKAISGDDNFYVVNKTFNYIPTEIEIAKWERYLDSVAVCNAIKTGQSCVK